MDVVTAMFRSPSLPAALAAGIVLWLGAAPVLAQDPPPAREVAAAIPRHFPPQYHVDADGKPIGFAIDVMDAVAKRANLRVHYRVEENWVDVMAAVRERRADLIPNLGITPERQRDFDFSPPVETFPVSVYVRRDYDKIMGVGDLAGHRVAVVAGNVAVDLLKERSGVELVIHPSFEASLFALLAGEVDAFVAPAPPVLALAREARMEDRIQAVGKPLIEIKRAMAVRKGDAELLARLDHAIEPFMDSEEYRAIYLRWHVPAAPFWTVARLAWLAGFLLVASLLGMAVWRYASLARANRQLGQQLDELRRFQKLTTGRELRMKELREENALLKKRLGEPAPGDSEGPAT